MKTKCFWEHNGDDSLLYSTEYLGAFTRGKSVDIAKLKMPQEIKSFIRWSGINCPKEEVKIETFSCLSRHSVTNQWEQLD